MTHDERHDDTSPETPLRDELDLEAWRVDSPPSDFAERVLTRVAQEKRAPARARMRSRFGVWTAVASLGAAAAIAIVWTRGGAPTHGELVARERVEASIGSRARVVLEPGAAVSWNGDDVEQKQGDVFYRVEPGARFRVHTAAGDIEVKGTCFGVRVRDMQKRDLKSGAVGAAVTALAFVGVYEGRVAVSHAGQRVEIGAGESARTGSGNLTKASLGDGDRAFEANAAAASESDPLANANRNLVDQVSDYRRRLDTLAEQKTQLEAKLASSEKQLEAARANGTAPREKNEFDLDPNEWKSLAETATIKARTPCVRETSWEPTPETLNKLGLAPADGAILKNAYAHSNERVWNALRPICAAALGSAEVAARLGANTCQHLVLDLERRKDGPAVEEAMAFVGEVRAGIRPMPEPNAPIHPVAKMFLAVTGESKAFEAELAQSLGPEEAHRVTFAEDMCMSQSTWSGRRRDKK